MSSTPPPAAPPQSFPPGVPAAQSETADDRADIPPWPAWTAPAAVALGFGLGIFVTIFVGIGAKAGGSSLTSPTPAVALIADLVFDLSFVAAAIYFASRGRRPARPADFGFRRVRWDVAVAAVFVTAVVYYVVTAFYASLFNLHGTDKLPSPLGTTKSPAALAGIALFVCVVAPIAEEFFFRGFLFGALRHLHVRIARRDLGTWVAAIITGILFGLAHTGSALSQDLVPLGFLGFLLCVLRWRTRSLYPCMALHSLNNSLALGINQLHWSTAEILGLMAGSILVIAAITGPLTIRSPATT